MMPAIDFHVHLFEAKLGWSSHPSMSALKNTLRFSSLPAVRIAHSLQTLYRIFPKEIRYQIDRFAPLPAAAGVFLESKLEDLENAMKESHVEHSVLIASPPYIMNEFIVKTARSNPSRYTAAVNIVPRTLRPAEKLSKYFNEGAKILKIHPALDGEGPESLHYRALLKRAEELGMIVILHTGCIHSSLMYRKPELGEVQRFSSWFKQYPSIQFVLAHMNFHQPEIAMDLAETHPNLWLDISWQPLESIVEAIRRVGSERILFGTDWPILGNNMCVMRSRIKEGLDSGLIRSQEAAQILRLNALKLLKLEPLHASAT